MMQQGPYLVELVRYIHLNPLRTRLLTDLTALDGYAWTGNRVALASASTHIARAIEVVRRHFSDVDHHARNRVHPDVVFTPLAGSEEESRFRKTIRILGIPVVDEVVLRRQADGSITEEDSVAGPSTGMRLIFFRTAR